MATSGANEEPKVCADTPTTPAAVEVIRSGRGAYVVVDGCRLPFAVAAADVAVRPDCVPEVRLTLRPATLTVSDLGVPPASPATAGLPAGLSAGAALGFLLDDGLNPVPMEGKERP